MRTNETHYVASPIGTIVVVANAEGIVSLTLTARKKLPRTDEISNPWLKKAEAALRSYFAGDLRALDALPFAGKGTRFQERVWAALRTIPAGTTWSYRELADAVARPKAVRAVGQANKRNPAAFMVPCHRVVSADGTLGGYALGLKVKTWLLNHERSHAVPPPRPSRAQRTT